MEKNMTKCPYISLPFKNHHRARLERLVKESFEYIELYYHEQENNGYIAYKIPAMPDTEFQKLIAAEYYLRTTKT
jgi:hypothetical protein